VGCHIPSLIGRALTLTKGHIHCDVSKWNVLIEPYMRDSD
jgi:RIO-like serine/threonine protein kinase